MLCSNGGPDAGMYDVDASGTDCLFVEPPGLGLLVHGNWMMGRREMVRRRNQRRVYSV